MSKPDGSQQLQRQLNPGHVWAIAFGCIVGWGSFINPGKKFLPNSGVAGTILSVAFMVLQLIPIPGLSGVHFGNESYMMLGVWIILGIIFYALQRKKFDT